MFDPQVVGANLKAERARRSLSQKDLAAIIGISEVNLGKYERGENVMGLDKAYKFAEFFNVPIDSLVGRT